MSETARLSPGDTAPEFTLPDDTGAEVALGDFLGRKVIVYFYPAAMTPGCTKQACDFTDSLDSLKAAGLRGARHLARTSPRSSPSSASATASPSPCSPTPTGR